MSKEVSNIKKHRKSKFTQISNTIVNDKDLSLKAKGLFVYLWSKPDDWKYHRTDILNHCTEGKDAVLSGMKELEQYGYMVREARLNKGMRDGYIYHLSDEPDFLKEEMKTPADSTMADNPPSSTMEDYQVADNPPLSNTNSTNTKSVADESTTKPLEGDREGKILANQLVDDMLKMKPNLKVGDKRESFAKDFALAIRRDGRTYGEMSNILQWLQSGGKNAEFWKTVILSGKKLREQVDQLQINMEKDGYRPGTDGLTKEVLREYLIREFGRSKEIASFQQDGKVVKIGFVGEYYTFANYNSGELLDKKTANWLWSYMLDNHLKLFPKFKG